MEKRLPFVCACLTALLYLSFPSARYNFDGVACAIAVELGDLKHLVHGNHLAYGFLGYAWFLIWKVLGYTGPAIQSLQVFSSLLGAAGVGIFVLVLTRCGIYPVAAAIGALGLAVSGVYWAWSLEAQVYPLGVLFLFWTAAEISRDRLDPRKIGLLHGAAVLGHVGHLMFLPAVLYRIRDSRARRRYAAALIGAVVLTYAAAAVFCIHPRSWEDVRTWLLGSAALTMGKKFQWHGAYSLSGAGQWIGVSLRMFGGDVWIGLLAIGLAAVGAVASWNKRPKIVRVCLLWLAGYAFLFLSWEPFTPVYRITDLAPLWILIIFGIDSLSHSAGGGRVRAGIQAGALAGGVVFLGLWNFARDIHPNSRPERNEVLQRSLWLARATPENAWIAAESADQVYLPYFAHRKPLNLRYFEGHEDVLAQRVKALESKGEPVFVAPEVLSPEWRRWFSSLRLEKKDEWGGYTLYEIH